LAIAFILHGRFAQVKPAWTTTNEIGTRREVAELIWRGYHFDEQYERGGSKIKLLE
jgi:hypothetical protein